MLRGDRTRSFSTIGAYRKWCNHADSVGFPVGGMQMVLGVDATHLHVFTSTFLLGRAKRLAGSVPLSSIAQFTVVRGLTKSRIALLYSDGAFIEFEAFSRRGARKLVEAAIAHRDSQR